MKKLSTRIEDCLRKGALGGGARNGPEDLDYTEEYDVQSWIRTWFQQAMDRAVTARDVGSGNHFRIGYR